MLGVGNEVGAVYSPVVVIWPQGAPEQPAPETLQVTAVFALPETVAVNCCCREPGASRTELGETVTETAANADVAHATSAQARSRRSSRNRREVNTAPSLLEEIWTFPSLRLGGKFIGHPWRRTLTRTGVFTNYPPLLLRLN
jgi:hypothetical protein